MATYYFWLLCYSWSNTDKGNVKLLSDKGIVKLLNAMGLPVQSKSKGLAVKVKARSDALHQSKAGMGKLQRNLQTPSLSFP